MNDRNGHIVGIEAASTGDSNGSTAAIRSSSLNDPTSLTQTATQTTWVLQF